MFCFYAGYPPRYTVSHSALMMFWRRLARPPLSTVLRAASKILHAARNQSGHGADDRAERQFGQVRRARVRVGLCEQIPTQGGQVAGQDLSASVRPTSARISIFPVNSGHIDRRTWEGLSRLDPLLDACCHPLLYGYAEGFKECLPSLKSIPGVQVDERASRASRFPGPLLLPSPRRRLHAQVLSRLVRPHGSQARCSSPTAQEGSCGDTAFCSASP